MSEELNKVHAFLLGEGPLDGFHFGDSDTGRPRPAYWWRNNLRAAIASAQQAAPKHALTDRRIMELANLELHPHNFRWAGDMDEICVFAHAVEAESAPNALLVAVIHKAQAILARHLPPDGPSCKDTISELLGLLDGPESRAALASIPTAPEAT